MGNHEGQAIRQAFEDQVKTFDQSGFDPKVLVTVVQLPNGALETAVNSYDLQDKISYILHTYDDAFRLSANKAIRIVGFILA